MPGLCPVPLLLPPDQQAIRPWSRAFIQSACLMMIIPIILSCRLLVAGISKRLVPSLSLYPPHAHSVLSDHGGNCVSILDPKGLSHRQPPLVMPASRAGIGVQPMDDQCLAADCNARLLYCWSICAGVECGHNRGMGKRFCARTGDCETNRSERGRKMAGRKRSY
jgi:hypothetical protein